MDFSDNAEKSHITQCRESGLVPGETPQCQNPACGNPLAPKKKHAPVKYYCSTKCTESASIIKRARHILRELSDDELLRVMRERRKALVLTCFFTNETESR